MTATPTLELPTFLQPSADADAAHWSGPSRQKALELARKLGVPDRRNEAYRFTRTRELFDTDFARPLDTTHDGFTADDLATFNIADLDTRRLVFVDGRFHAGLSHPLDDLPAGVTAMRMADALDRPELRDRVEKHLGRYTEYTDDVFTAINHAHFDDGFFVHVDDGCRMDKPLHVLSVATGRAEPFAAHARNLVVAGRNAHATVIERFVSLDNHAVYFNNAVTELVVDAEGDVHHYLLEQESEAAFNMSALIVHQEARSNVHSHTVLLGGKLCRNSVIPVLNGTQAHCLVNGLYVGHGEQTLDNAMHINHSAEDCQSRRFYKGILDDRATGIFTGRIKVTEEGQQTDAVQSNRSMLLSDDARAVARPQLEIYADDVKCTHGCTTGEVDPEAVFYFRSRGLPEPIARAMLLYAFAAEGFQRMELVPVRKLLAAEMIAKLPGAENLSIEVGDSEL